MRPFANEQHWHIVGLPHVLAALLFAVALCLVAPVFCFADEITGEENTDTAATADDSADSGDNLDASASSGANSDSSSDASASSSASAKPNASSEAPVDLEGEANTVDPAQRADNSFIYDTTIESLFSEPSLYEDRTVQVVGEAIGDIVVASPLNTKYCWITMTSTDVTNPSTISVFLSEDQAKQIDHLGRYGVTGTILQVRGTYHQACSEHEGIPDIHATETSAIERGVEHPDLFELTDYIPGTIAIFIGLALMGIYYIVRERTR